MNLAVDADSAGVPSALGLAKVGGLTAHGRRHGPHTNDASLRCSKDQPVVLPPGLRVDFARERPTLLLRRWGCLHRRSDEWYDADSRRFFGATRAQNSGDQQALTEAARADLSRSAGWQVGPRALPIELPLRASMRPCLAQLHADRDE
jgi:hypothetical protein